MENLVLLFSVTVVIGLMWFIKNKSASQNKADGTSNPNRDLLIRLGFFHAPQNFHFAYAKKEYYISVAERYLYERLQQIIPSSYVVFPQVLLSSIVKPECDKSEFWKYQNKINRKTLDFVIFEKPNLKPVIAIELDGITHEWKSREARDEFVDSVLEAAGLKIIHAEYNARNEYHSLQADIMLKISDAFPRSVTKS